MNRLIFYAFIFVFYFNSCTDSNKDDDIPVIGYVDAFEDETMDQAMQGWKQALKDSGYVADSNIKIIYRNAQGNIPTLNQIISYYKQQSVDAIVSCPSIATIAAVQNTRDIPVFMLVSPEPRLINLQVNGSQPDSLLYGVGENLDYIDSSLQMIKTLLHNDQSLRIGMIFNQSEPQSVEALKRIQKHAKECNMMIIAKPVNSSADLHITTQALLDEDIDAFFANPDNTVFSGFEVILKNCNNRNVPVFTSESGLVARGAVAAYGADIYEWGYQCGTLLVRYLDRQNDKQNFYELVKVRNKVYNPDAAIKYGIEAPSDFRSIFDKK